MRKVLRHLLLVPFAVLTLSMGFSNSTAFAEDSYFGIHAGGVILEDSTISIPGFLPADLSSSTGVGVGVTFGQSFQNFRVEGELTYRSNDTDKLSDPSGTISITGDTSSFSFMANGYYDIKTTSSIYPYFGLGIGISQVSIDASFAGVKLLDDSATVFAYQFIAGVGIPVSPKTTIDINYKYFATADPSFSTTGGTSVESEYKTHNLMVGLRYKF